MSLVHLSEFHLSFKAYLFLSPRSVDELSTMSDKYDLIAFFAGIAGSMIALNFLEQCMGDKNQGRLAIIEVGKNGE